MKILQCPCHSGKNYADCCQSVHQLLNASNALALMRSRYSAYALGNIDYIMATTDPYNPHYKSDKSVWKNELNEFCKMTKFEGLDIISFEDGDSVAYVTFRAHLKQYNQKVSYKEKSRFKKINDRWMYSSGEVTPA